MNKVFQKGSKYCFVKKNKTIIKLIKSSNRHNIDRPKTLGILSDNEYVYHISWDIQNNENIKYNFYYK